MALVLPVVLAKLSYLPLFCQKGDCVEKLPLQLLHVVSLRHCSQVENPSIKVQSFTEQFPF